MKYIKAAILAIVYMLICYGLAFLFDTSVAAAAAPFAIGGVAALQAELMENGRKHD